MSVLGRLFAEGWVSEVEIAQLKQEKVEQIKRSASVWKKADA